MGRPRWRSLFLSDPDATFLELFPHPSLRVALNASPYGRRRASLRPGCGKCQGNRRTKKTNPTSSEINLLQQENGLDLGVHLSSE